MEIKILHLLYDLMNLYGEYGNVNVIKYRLEKQGANVLVDKKTIGDEIHFNDYDFIYMGSGTEKNQLVALDFLKNYKSYQVLYLIFELIIPLFFVLNYLRIFSYYKVSLRILLRL